VAQLQFLGNRLVTAQIGILQVFQKAAALADHDQQPATRAVIFLIGLQVLGQMIDALRQQRDLHIGLPSVLAMQLK